MMGARSRNSYILTRILIILAIIIPFILKSIDSHLEPYPAVILPGAAGKTKSPKNDLIFYKKQEIFALTHDSNKIKIQRSDLFTDLPLNFEKKLLIKDLI